MYIYIYTSNEQLEFEILKPILLAIASRKIEVFRCKPNKICTRYICRKLQNTSERNQRKSK